MGRLKRVLSALNTLRRRIQKAVARWWDVAVAVS
jgi:hypothetical protein